MVSYNYDLISLYEFIGINTSLLAPWMGQLVLHQFVPLWLATFMMLFLFMNLLGYLSEMSTRYIHTPPKVLFMDPSPCIFEF